MKITELNDNERLALFGLLKMVIQADQKVSSEEMDELNKVAEQIGQETWKASKALAAERFPDLNAVRLFAETEIKRQEARELIHGLVKEMAAADSDDPMEESVLRWLARVWNIRE